ncbi:MAG TPA: alpha/beta hydrolase [Allosphingosinicella sp.]|nr:alpha/beta hydrolase [Allosphingosinicella sp.]
MVNEAAAWRVHPEGAVFSEWAAPDGFPLRRMDWAPAGRGKGRGSLLFVNGRGDFIEKYLESYAHFQGQGWHVTSFDWRGQGASRGPGEEKAWASFDVLVDDLEALIADWRAAGPGPHVVLGHSMGGHLVLRALVDRKPAVDAAVLTAPMLDVNSAPIPIRIAPDVADTMYWLGFGNVPMWKTPPSMLAPGGRRNRNLTGSRARYEDELHWWGVEPGFNIGPPSFGWMRAAFRSRAATFTAERLGRVTLPILIVGAEQDRLVSAAAIREAAALLPNATLVMMPDAAHEILRDDDPVRDEALARIDAFLAGLKG